MLSERVRIFFQLNFCLRLYDEVRGSISAFMPVFVLCAFFASVLFMLLYLSSAGFYCICLLQVFIAIAACVAAFFFLGISRDKPVKTKSVQVKHTHTHTHARTNNTCVEASRKVAGRQLL